MIDLLKIAFGKANHKRVMARIVICENLYENGVPQTDIARLLKTKQPRVCQMIQDAYYRNKANDVYYCIMNNAFTNQKEQIMQLLNKTVLN